MKDKLYYFGIHKASSTYVIEVLYDLCKRLELKHEHYHSNKVMNYNINQVANNLDVISYTNADYNVVKSIDHNYKGFHLIRDPRDIIVSSYFSHRYSHSDNMWPEINDYRKELETLNLEQGLTATIRHLEAMVIDGENVPVLHLIRDWDYSNSNILELNFEDFSKNLYINFTKVIKYLGLLNEKSLLSRKVIIGQTLVNFLGKGRVGNTITLEEFLALLYKHDFYFKSKGREKGKTNKKSHYRSGKSGDWRNYLTPSHISYIKDNYGQFLIERGYEKNLDW